MTFLWLLSKGLPFCCLVDSPRKMLGDWLGVWAWRLFSFVIALSSFVFPKIPIWSEYSFPPFCCLSYWILLEGMKSFLKQPGEIHCGECYPLNINRNSERRAILIPSFWGTTVYSFFFIKEWGLKKSTITNQETKQYQESLGICSWWMFTGALNPTMWP